MSERNSTQPEAIRQPENPPAFPSQFYGHVGHYANMDGDHSLSLNAEGGMTLRDYFAAAVAPVFAREFLADGDAWSDYGELAESIYGVADAMLVERMKAEGR